MGAKTDDSEQLFNRNLTALIAVIFLFYGGLSCLYSTLVPHLISLGFRSIEISYMLTIVALISIIGPLIFAPLIDLIADRRKGQFGSFLQYILALLLVLGAISYGCLLLVPTVQRTPMREPAIAFGCNSSGAVIFQHRCSEGNHCRQWDDEKFGKLWLVNCSYQCQNPAKFEDLYNEWPSEVSLPLTDLSKDIDYENDEVQSPSPTQPHQRRRRYVKPPLVHPPHICRQSKENASIIEECKVFIKDISKIIEIDAKLRSAQKQENDTKWCRYPIGKCSILSI